MAIKPIDMQTNISQMHEIGKNEHNRSLSINEQQHILDKESADKAKLINNKLDETKKGEHTSIRDEEGNKKKKHENKEKVIKKKISDVKKSGKPLSDDRVGRIIDIFK